MPVSECNRWSRSTCKGRALMLLPARLDWSAWCAPPKIKSWRPSKPPSPHSLVRSAFASPAMCSAPAPLNSHYGHMKAWSGRPPAQVRVTQYLLPGGLGSIVLLHSTLQVELNPPSSQLNCTPAYALPTSWCHQACRVSRSSTRISAFKISRLMSSRAHAGDQAWGAILCLTCQMLYNSLPDQLHWETVGEGERQ